MSVTVELYLGGSWTDITSYVRQDPGIGIDFGIRSEGSVADANQATLTVNNGDGRFSPRNTAGAYYGNLKRNTPIRIKVGTTERFHGEIAEFPTRWDESGKDAYAPLIAAGILRRLQRASSLASTLSSAITYLANTNADITGYWPCEDSAGSTSIASGLVGGRPGKFTGAPVFDSVDLGVGTHNVPTWGGATATFIPTAGSSTAFTAGCYVQLPASGVLTGGEELFRVDVAGTAKSWRVLYSPGSGGGVFCQALDKFGTEILDSSTVTGLDGLTFYVKIECSNSGSNVAWAFGTLDAGTTYSGTLSSQTVGAPQDAAIGSGIISIPADAGVAIGHVVLGTSSTALAHSTFDSGRAAYAGETAAARLSRLATQYGITMTTISGYYSPVEMGPQPDGTLLDVLRALEKADAGGILRDAINDVALVYITRVARYNDQQAQLVLDYSSGDVSPPLEPTDDDQHIANDIKANRAEGSSARATLTSGALSTAAYPSGVGPYPFEETYATYSDDALPYLAQWLLALGTVNETRFPAVTVDLVRNPSLVTSAEAVRPGFRLRITNLPAYAGATNVDLQVLGWREELTAATRTITYVCAPGSVWTGIFRLDSSTFGVLDTDRLAF